MKYFKFTLILVIIIGFFTSCSDDKSKKDKTNLISVAGESFKITTATMESWSYSDNLANHELILSNYTEQELMQNVHDEKGIIIYIDLYTNSLSDLDERTYNLGNSQAGTYSDNSTVTIIKSSYSAEFYKFTGDIHISKEGTTYTIEFDCTATNANNVDIVLTYQGTIKKY